MSPRMSAEQRREMAIEAAVAEFARGGYEGTSTAAIAERVGVSQPYMFRLFPSKRALFLAAVDRCFADIEALLREAAGGRRGTDATAEMADAYRRILAEDPHLLRFQLQIYAAAVGDEEIGRIGHARWARLWRLISDVSGAEPAEVTRFMAVGMLVNVLTAFQVPYTPGPELPESLRDWAEGLRGAAPDAVDTGEER
ncbi:TetR/AcrR family transcriptional regulator [Actinomadura violacea]|uniref:TetR/AcrR family transcriptional regulator n=1 Tax=Actinomadura violacea TaxID=2819934 RepID=A0ABS3RU02_9ACTN|nr:TetR/AcrR family transcriptional regulator [Actinomadura violacea]MBO2460142.1 TetR/AcrR family transcriptional regulator [Actinomadura violacea]